MLTKIAFIEDEQFVCGQVYALAFLINLGLCLVIIPHYGAMGAAVSTSAAFVIESILLALTARRRLGLHVFVWRWAAKP